jgi:hypothetical protein
VTPPRSSIPGSNRCLDTTSRISAPCGPEVSLGLRLAMRCLACGGEMRLMEVSLADTPMAGFERQTSKCSSCSHISRRLVLSHPRSPGANLPVVPLPPEPPATELQMKHVIAGSVRAKLSEKLRSRQLATQERAARAGTSTWAEAVEKLRSKQAALKKQSAIARPQSDECVRFPAASQDPQRHLQPSTTPPDR